MNERGRRTLSLWVALVFLLSACAPASGSLGGLVETPIFSATAPPAATATPTVDWFPPTSTPTAAPTQPVTPTPDLRPGIGPALLADAIASQPWSTGKSTLGAVTRSGSELTLAVSAPKATLTSFLDTPQLGDVYLEVSVDPSLCRGGDSFGLLLRSAGASSFYRWAVTCDGKQTLERVQNGSFLALQPVTPRIGPPSPTRLAAYLSGRTLRFFIDDVYQFSISDTLYPSGRLGVFARSAADTPVTVTFSSLSIYSLSPSLTPSPSPGGREEKNPGSATPLP